MKVLGIRFCAVSAEAEKMAAFFRSLGLPERNMKPCDLPPSSAFSGAIFPAGSSWIEVWKQGPEIPAGIMLQVIVDDADAFAEHARKNGLDPKGPMDAHGERMYFLQGPGGLQVSFQSACH